MAQFYGGFSRSLRLGLGGTQLDPDTACGLLRPARVDPVSGHDFEITDLPEISRGSMDNVMATLQTLAGGIEDNGYRATGYPREVYLECPEDRDKWVTELQEAIEKESG